MIFEPIFCPMYMSEILYLENVAIAQFVETIKLKKNPNENEL